MVLESAIPPHLAVPRTGRTRCGEPGSTGLLRASATPEGA